MHEMTSNQRMNVGSVHRLSRRSGKWVGWARNRVPRQPSDALDQGVNVFALTTRRFLVKVTPPTLFEELHQRRPRQRTKHSSVSWLVRRRRWNHLLDRRRYSSARTQPRSGTKPRLVLESGVANPLVGSLCGKPIHLLGPTTVNRAIGDETRSSGLRVRFPPLPRIQVAAHCGRPRHLRKRIAPIVE
jgi:hypothetical protein